MIDIKNDGGRAGWTATPVNLGNPFSNPIKYTTARWQGTIKDLVCAEIGKPFYRVSCEAKKDGETCWHRLDFQIQVADGIVRGADPVEFAVKWVLPVLALAE